MLKACQKSKGFTLLEILLVVGILAILAGIVIIAINPGRQLAAARNLERKTDIGEIYKAMQQYYINHFSYPTSTPDTLTEICNTGSHPYPAIDIDCSGLTNLSALVPTYLTAIPHDPQVSAISFLNKVTPLAYASANGTGYYIQKNSVKHIVLTTANAELGAFIAIGTTTPLVVGSSGESVYYTLTVDGNHGLVTKSPNSINNNFDATVILSATPDTGYVFSNWSGDASGSTNPLTVTMTKNKAITANFTHVDNSFGPIVMDNTDSNAVVKVGSWATSTYSPGFYLSDYLHDGNNSKGNKSVTFSTTTPEAGLYYIYVQYPKNTYNPRATSTPVDILTNGGATKTIVLDQTINDSKWFLLTTNTYSANDVAGVRIRNTGTSGYVIADAVMLTTTPLPVDTYSHVIDNSDSGEVNLVGSWATSTYSPGYFGSNYLHDNNTGKDIKSVTFSTVVPESGTYSIYVQYPTDTYSPRATSTPVDILANGVSAKTVILNEHINGGGWFLLTTNTFNANDVAGVRIRNTGTSGYVMADAVKFVTGN